MGNEKAVTPPATKKAVTPPATKEVIITGTVRSNPEQGRVGYQQTIKVEGESLIALNGLIAEMRKKGLLTNSPTIVYGTAERGYYVHAPVSADIVANPKGSGKQIDNVVTISVADRNGWAHVMASVSAAAKAKADVKKAATLAAEAEKLAEMKATVSLFSKLGLNKQVVALQLLSEKTNGTLDVAAVYTALQGETSTPVSRSSRLAAAKQEEVSTKKSLGGNDDDEDLDGSEG